MLGDEAYHPQTDSQRRKMLSDNDNEMKQSLLANLCHGSQEMKGLISLTQSKQRFSQRAQPNPLN